MLFYYIFYFPMEEPIQPYIKINGYICCKSILQYHTTFVYFLCIWKQCNIFVRKVLQHICEKGFLIITSLDHCASIIYRSQCHRQNKPEILIWHCIFCHLSSQYFTIYDMQYDNIDLTMSLSRLRRYLPRS